MTTSVLTVTPDTLIPEAGRLLLDRDITALPVVDTDGLLVGVVSRSDLIRRRVLPDLRGTSGRSRWTSPKPHARWRKS